MSREQGGWALNKLQFVDNFASGRGRLASPEGRPRRRAASSATFGLFPRAKGGVRVPVVAGGGEEHGRQADTRGLRARARQCMHLRIA